MSSPRAQANPQSSLPFGEEPKPGFRTKTAATRLTPEELGEIEAAAESAGQALSEWLGRGPPLGVAARDRSVRCATAARRSRRTGVGRSLGVALRALESLPCSLSSGIGRQTIVAGFCPQNPRPSRRTKAPSGPQT